MEEHHRLVPHGHAVDAEFAAFVRLGEGIRPDHCDVCVRQGCAHGAVVHESDDGAGRFFRILGRQLRSQEQRGGNRCARRAHGGWEKS